MQVLEAFREVAAVVVVHGKRGVAEAYLRMVNA